MAATAAVTRNHGWCGGVRRRRPRDRSADRPAGAYEAGAVLAPPVAAAPSRRRAAAARIHRGGGRRAQSAPTPPSLLSCEEVLKKLVAMRVCGESGWCGLCVCVNRSPLAPGDRTFLPHVRPLPRAAALPCSLRGGPAHSVPVRRPHRAPWPPHDPRCPRFGALRPPTLVVLRGATAISDVQRMLGSRLCSADRAALDGAMPVLTPCPPPHRRVSRRHARK